MRTRYLFLLSCSLVVSTFLFTGILLLHTKKENEKSFFSKGEEAYTISRINKSADIFARERFIARVKDAFEGRKEENDLSSPENIYSEEKTDTQLEKDNGEITLPLLDKEVSFPEYTTTSAVSE